MIRLLVVDDSALMRRLMGTIFEGEGDFELRFARDGAEGLEIVKSWRPSVVTLDVTMPVMDGLSCLSRIMLEAPVPVVMVSAQTREGAEATFEAMQLGAVDFIAKPKGTISLCIDTFGPLLVEKVRAAAFIKPRQSLRLRERVRHRLSPVHERPPVPAEKAAGGQLTAALAEGEVEGLVLIGASTGGPQAVEAILLGLPGDFPWPVLVAQHMPATFTGVFARRLAKACDLDVVEVTHPMPLLPGRVHIGHGDADLVVGRRPSGLIAQPLPSSPAFHWHPSVDRLVESALRHVQASRLLGVLITGMGCDGAEQMARLRALGGHTIAEDESTAVVWGMPGALVARGGAGLVRPLPDIAAEIAKLVG